MWAFVRSAQGPSDEGRRWRDKQSNAHPLLPPNPEILHSSSSYSKTSSTVAKSKNPSAKGSKGKGGREGGGGGQKSGSSDIGELPISLDQRYT